jgi:hypothetical protein
MFVSVRLERRRQKVLQKGSVEGGEGVTGFVAVDQTVEYVGWGGGRQSSGVMLEGRTGSVKFFMGLLPKSSVIIPHRLPSHIALGVVT